MWSQWWRSWALAMAVFCCAGVQMANGTTAEVLVCWGDTGDIPAVALLEPDREPRVLLTGGFSDGSTLAWYLEQQGKLLLAEVLMPTWAPFPRGAVSLAKKCGIRQLTVIRDSKSRLNWADLRQTLTASGTAIVQREMSSDRSWHFQAGDWLIQFQRLKPSGTFRVSLSTASQEGAAAVYYFEQRVTGVFVVGREGRSEPILEVPKSNRRGVIRIRLEEQSERVIPVNIEP